MKTGRKFLFRALAFLLALLSGSLVVLAQQQSQPMLVNYVSASLVSSGPKPQVVPNPDAGTENPRNRDVVATPPKKSTEGDRWQEFENEYGIHQRNPLWLLSMLQSAKYQVDRLSFGAKETAKRLEFTYDIGSPNGSSGEVLKPQYSLPLFGRFGHPQIRSVLTEHDPQTGTAFVGLKLSVPFGE